jgi:hypothetical protein
MIDGRWHFIKLETEAAVAKFEEVAKLGHRDAGEPKGCEARLRIEPGGSLMLFLNSAASAVVAQAPLFCKMMRPLQPELVARLTATSDRMSTFDGKADETA